MRMNNHRTSSCQRDICCTAGKTPECITNTNCLKTTAISFTCLSSGEPLSFFTSYISSPWQTLDQLWIWRGLRWLPLIIPISQNGGEEIPLSVVSEVFSPKGRDPDIQRDSSHYCLGVQAKTTLSHFLLLTLLTAITMLLGSSQREHWDCVAGCLWMLLMRNSSGSACG